MDVIAAKIHGWATMVGAMNHRAPRGEFTLQFSKDSNAQKVP